jgi:hypothetical protein
MKNAKGQWNKEFTHWKDTHVSKTLATLSKIRDRTHKLMKLEGKKVTLKSREWLGNIFKAYSNKLENLDYICKYLEIYDLPKLD